MPASSVSLPTPVASHVSRPSWFTVPAYTLAPAAFAAARDLAGQHAFVDARRAVAHDAVDRHALAGAHDEAVAGDDLGSGTSTVAAVAHHVRGLRLQAQQALERRRRAGLRARFQHLAEQAPA